jgi:stalled ribosome rescue protein Dom34
MNRELGLWIDHKQAFVIWSGNKQVDVIPSNLERRTHFSGGTRIGGTYNQSVDTELRYNGRYELQLKKFYSEVIATMQNADSIFIMGPGEAKLELEKAMEKRKALRRRVIKVETATKMTKNQMIAKVQGFFTRLAESRQ